MRILLLFLFITNSVLSAALSKPVLHALVIGDTTCPKLKHGFEASVNHVTVSISTIAKAINYDLKLTTLKGKRTNTEQIEKWLKQLVKKPNDIVFFFYNGHGSRNTIKGPWPVIWPKYDGYQPGLSGATIIQYLRKQPNKLTIILFDTCNKTMTHPHLVEIKSEECILLPKGARPGIKNLFLNNQGFIIGTSSTPGEPSWNQPEGEGMIGGFFINSLLQAFETYSQNQSVLWETIFTSTKRQCDNLSNGKQHPIFVFEKQEPHIARPIVTRKTIQKIKPKK